MPKPPLKPPISVTVAVELARAQMTQAQMAAVLEISAAGFTDRMLGRTTWKFREIETMARHLGVSVERFADDPAAEQASA